MKRSQRTHDNNKPGGGKPPEYTEGRIKMTQHKAKKTGVVMRYKYCSFVEYEYRGRKYEVEFANCSTYCVTSPKVQHEDAQARIDKELDTPKEAATEKNTKTAWEALDEWFAELEA